MLSQSLKVKEKSVLSILFCGPGAEIWQLSYFTCILLWCDPLKKDGAWGTPKSSPIELKFFLVSLLIYCNGIRGVQLIIKHFLKILYTLTLGLLTVHCVAHCHTFLTYLKGSYQKMKQRLIKTLQNMLHIILVNSYEILL